MELDIGKIADKLLQELELETTFAKGMKKGVQAFYERIQQAATETGIPGGEKKTGTEQASPSPKAPGPESTRPRIRHP